MNWRQMQYLFMIEAAKYNVFPLDDRRYERFNAATAGRPDLAGDRSTQTFWPGMDTQMENTVLNTKNRSHTVTAEIEVPSGTLDELGRWLGDGGVDGVLVAQGGRFAGWSLYVKNGRAKFCHNWFDHDYYYVEAKEPLPSGTVNIRYHFDFDGEYGGGEPAGCTTTTSSSGTLEWVRIDLEDQDVIYEEPEDLKYRRIMAQQ